MGDTRVSLRHILFGTQSGKWCEHNEAGLAVNNPLPTPPVSGDWIARRILVRVIRSNAHTEAAHMRMVKEVRMETFVWLVAPLAIALFGFVVMWGIIRLTANRKHPSVAGGDESTPAHAEER